MEQSIFNIQELHLSLKILVLGFVPLRCPEGRPEGRMKSFLDWTD
jgi:hypothetical protein